MNPEDINNCPLMKLRPEYFGNVKNNQKMSSLFCYFKSSTNNTRTEFLVARSGHCKDCLHESPDEM